MMKKTVCDVDDVMIIAIDIDNDLLTMKNALI